MAGDGPSVQLRFGFSAPTMPIRLHLTISGMTAVVTPSPGLEGQALAHLTALGVNAKVDEVRGLLFPVRELPRLRDLPPNVDVVALGPSSVLWEMVVHPPDLDLPVRITHDTQDTLNLSWVVDGLELNEPLPASLAPALTAMEIPLVASQETWSNLLAAARWMAVVGRCRSNVDGYIEITTSVPQQLEMSPIPGLFRVSATHYGCPVSSAAALDSIVGLVWEGAKPSTRDDAPAEGLTAYPLSVFELASTPGLVVVGDAAPTRAALLRFLADSDNLPTAVVTLPYLRWEWSISVLDAGLAADSVHVVCYDNFPGPDDLPTALVFDRLDLALLAESAESMSAAHALDGVVSMTRLATAQELPVDPTNLVQFMSLVRPMEFRADVPVALRYPPPSRDRLREHADSYARALPADLPPRVRTHCVELPLELSAPEPDLPPLRALDSHLRRASYGSDLLVSPKVATAVELARSARAQSHRTLVLTRYSETRSLLRTLLRRDGAQELSEKSEESLLVVALLDEPWWSCRPFDEIILVDYPWSAPLVLDYLANHAITRMSILHALGSVDDNLAVFGLLKGASAPSVQGAEWLLSRASDLSS